jgi:hypothetical protein
VASILWRRLDTPGHDACRLEQDGSGWQLDGAAVFRHEDGRLARLNYRVQSDGRWHSRSGTVRGWLGDAAVDLAITRDTRGAWILNGTAVPGLEHCPDLDLGFTPATNLFQVCRLDLDVGQGADALAAWIDLDERTLSELAQRYERRGERSYWYTAPRFGYAALLEVTEDGFVWRYPGLWEAEA